MSELIVELFAVLIVFEVVFAGDLFFKIIIEVFVEIVFVKFVNRLDIEMVVDRCIGVEQIVYVIVKRIIEIIIVVERHFRIVAVRFREGEARPNILTRKVKKKNVG